jgi:hypothetical protein
MFRASGRELEPATSELLGDDQHLRHTESVAAVLLREREAVVAERRQLLVEVLRVIGVLIPLLDAFLRRFLVDQVPHRFAQ